MGKKKISYPYHKSILNPWSTKPYPIHYRKLTEQKLKAHEK